jgi:drug/metabolite transporter (DMT)-like permease
MAAALFGEVITWLAVAGMGLIAVGVVLARPPLTRSRA